MWLSREKSFGQSVSALLETYDNCLKLLKAFKRQREEQEDGNSRKAAKANKQQALLKHSLKGDRKKVERAYSSRLAVAGAVFEKGDPKSRTSLTKVVTDLNAAIANLVRVASESQSPVLDYQSLMILSNASRIEAIKTFDQLSRRLDKAPVSSVASAAKTLKPSTTAAKTAATSRTATAAKTAATSKTAGLPRTAATSKTSAPLKTAATSRTATTSRTAATARTAAIPKTAAVGRTARTTETAKLSGSKNNKSTSSSGPSRDDLRKGSPRVPRVPKVSTVPKASKGHGISSSARKAEPKHSSSSSRRDKDSRRTPPPPPPAPVPGTRRKHGRSHLPDPASRGNVEGSRTNLGRAASFLNRFSLMSTASDSTKLGEIPEKKWHRKYDPAEGRLDEYNTPVMYPIRPYKAKPKEKEKKFLGLFRRG